MAVKSRSLVDKSLQDRIVISGIGVVTSVGCSVWGTALALRNRKSAWCEHETVLVADDAYGIVLRGATVSRVPEEAIAPELDGAERAIALLAPAIGECIAGLSSAEVERLDCRIDNFVAHDRQEFLPRLREAFPKLLVPHEQEQDDPAAELGRCAFPERIIRAAEKLRGGDALRAIIGTVDSLCATSWLMTVRDEGILKDSLTPEGIIAGEAAGAVLLERESDARKRNAPILAAISSWGRGMEPNGWEGPIPSTGRGLTDAFFEAFSTLDDKGKSIGAVIADLNGQRPRALDWAYTEGRIFPDGERERELRHPAFTSGDCGGATGAVLLADAVSRLAFHPGFRGRIALSTSDEAGARRVICLERGDHFERRALMEQVRKHVEVGTGKA